MSDPIYFQWQNKTLLKTIYPLREMKLRDFLVYYYEIDLWSEYKDKSDQDFKPEKDAYQAAQNSQWTVIFQKYADLRDYFLEEDVTDRYREKFPDFDQAFMDQINAIHKSFRKYFPNYKDPRKERVFLVGRISKMEELHKGIQKEVASKQRTIRNMGSDWGKADIYQKSIEKLEGITLKMADMELTSLYDFLGDFDKMRERRDQANKWFKDNKKGRASIATELKKKQWYVNRYPDKPQYAQEAGELEDQIKQLDKVINRVKDLPEKEQLAEISTAQKVTRKLVLRGKAEQYRESLSQKNHEQLLEEVVRKFLEEPARYPLWLQYMVIHFSGMRYKSAHGSWADPRELLQSLRMNSLIENDKRSSDATIETDAAEKIVEYEKKRKKEQDQTRRDKIQYYLDGMKSSKPYRKRKALLDLRIDEENDLVDEGLSDEQVLEELEEIQERDKLPDWMWKEIVAQTDLRLKYATDESWEELSPDEKEERNNYESRIYRDIMIDWKKKNLTGWREEHDRDNRLIVTRAVCNEVSEHIQHLRGHTPPGGLTSKPEWYLRNERHPDLVNGRPKPYFLKPDSRDDFTVGSTLLWLRWVNRLPNAWRIAHPLKLKNGEGLLPAGTVKRAARQAKKNKPKHKAKAAKQPTDWKNEISGRAFKRNRTVLVELEKVKVSAANKSGKPKGQGKKKVKKKTNQVKSKKKKMVRKEEQQWLRWMHEATVAEVAETADGTVVLTFETALPYEDKRRSTIGVFKHTVGELKYRITPRRFNGTFVGYVPEDKVNVPYADLEDMLDWNKILRREVLSETEMKTYWQKVKLREKESVAITPSDADSKQKDKRQPRMVIDSPVEVAPSLAAGKHKDWILCYRVDPAKKKAVVYKPKVMLARGMQLRVVKSSAVKIGKRTYYQVSRCDDEPRAEERYIRKDSVIDLPKGQVSRPVEAKGVFNLRRITSGNRKVKPVMGPTGIKLMDGTPFRISTVHKVTTADSGDGVIDADGIPDYYLIVKSPRKGRAKGLFIQTQAVNRISEEEYTRRFNLAQKEAALPPELQMVVVPKAGGDMVTLFKAIKASSGKAQGGNSRQKQKGSGPRIRKSVKDTLPKGDELTVASTKVVSKGKEYYRIIKYKHNSDFKDLYILAKEVKPLPKASSEGEPETTSSGTGAVPASRGRRPEHE